MINNVSNPTMTTLNSTRRPFDEVIKGCSGCKAFLPNLHSFQNATEEQLFQDLGIS